jgi:hypothetical protein
VKHPAPMAELASKILLGGRAYGPPSLCSSCSWAIYWMVIHSSKRAFLTASLLEETPILGEALDKWRLTVASENLSALAIWWLERPRATSTSISIYRTVSTPPEPSSASSNIARGMPTTTWCPLGSKTAALTAPMRCSVETLFSK